MKTTIDLDSDLLLAAKRLAVERRTTLRALVEHALRREIEPTWVAGAEPPALTLGPTGLPSLRRHPSREPRVTARAVAELQAGEGFRG